MILDLHLKKKENGKFVEIKEVPSEAGTYRVTANLYGDTNHNPATSQPLEFTISKKGTTLTFTEENIGKTYDGDPVSEPKVEKEGSSKDVKFTWLTKNGSGWNKLDDGLPTNVGEYKVVASVEEDTNYSGKSIEKAFSISIADNEFTEELSIEGWKYGEPKTPTAKALFGDVEFTYSSEENVNYTSKVPTNAGTYYVKAEVKGTDNYTGLIATKQFTIEKAEIPEEGGKIEVTVPEWVEGKRNSETYSNYPRRKTRRRRIYCRISLQKI